MSARTLSRNAQRRRRLITYSWILALALVTISLIYWEQTAILYILATLGVTVLLVVVALSDLSVGENLSVEVPIQDRTSAAGSSSLSATNNKSDWKAKKR